MVDYKHSPRIVVPHSSGLVRWGRHYHYVSSTKPLQTVCGMVVPPGSITRGKDFAEAIGHTKAVCTDCRDDELCSDLESRRLDTSHGL
jgi:hypothetical protein